MIIALFDYTWKCLQHWEEKNVELSAWPVNQRINEPAVHLETAVSYFSVSQLILSLKNRQAPGKSNL